MAPTLHGPEIPPEIAQLGGKGYALARLQRAGFPVPAWFVVPPGFGVSPEGPSPASANPTFTPAEEEKLQEAIHQLTEQEPTRADAEPRFAVRSSALDEDAEGASFAGQLDSFLEIKAADVPLFVHKVRKSLFSEHLQRYREMNHLPPPTSYPAVIVQRMVPADAAGVAFSANPVDGRRGQVVISAVAGLGEKLVSGEVDGDTWMVFRDGTMESNQTAPEGEASNVSKANLQSIADLAKRCAEFFGRPQDIEWALHGDQLYLLQSRPITTLKGRVDPDGVRNLWDNSNIAESYGGVTTPLTFSFAHYIYREVYQQFCRLLHVPESVIAAHRPVFNSMLGLIRGRVYYNLMSWYRMLALLPGFHLNRRFMEQMMGVKEPLSPEILQEIISGPKPGKLREAARFSWALIGLGRAYLGLPRMIKRFIAHFDRTLHDLPAPLTAMRADELAQHFHHLEEALLNRWDAPLINDFFAMIAFGLLRSSTRKWADDTEGNLCNSLLCGTGQIISAEPARRIREMAEIASSHPDFVAQLESADPYAINQAMRSVPSFSDLYHAYLDRFADRCLNELKLESATLRDNPLPLLRSIGGLARRLLRGNQPNQRAESELARQAESNLREKVAGHPLRAFLFRLLLKQTRKRVQVRENLRFERTRLFGHIRKLFLEIGKRLNADGAIDDPRDIFYLKIDEALGFVEGTSVSTDLRGLIAYRKIEYEAHAQSESPADRFTTRGVVHIGNLFQGTETSPSDPSEASQDPSRLQGIGCCPGKVEGRACVVHNPQEADLKEGDILVAEQTDPGWITLFPAAAAVLVERGSLLSHSAIVSREMGIPAIVSISGLLAKVRTGDRLEIDGAEGTIRIVNPANHEPAN
ncbi:MAG: hypothetical protein JJT75_04585 [Opitutales bacterium]|nr:hypothetical protein [Opitutales bacterium]MCH8540449.1 hypothetical protein [Opitutales bacterium]